LAADPFRNEAVLARLRAERAEATLTAVTVDRDVLKRVVDRRDLELAALRDLVTRQQARIAELTERLRNAEAAARQVALDAIVRALGAALETGEAGLIDRVIVAARAEIKAALQVSGGEAGLVLGAPGAYDADTLSTVTFDLRRLPPDAASERRGAALAALGTAVQDLQRALDPGLGDAAVDDALAAASALAAAPPPALDAAAAAMAPLAGALERLGAARPALGAATAAIHERRAALAARPEAEEGTALAAAVRDVAQRIAEPAP
jgi:hypothetical protein